MDVTLCTAFLPPISYFSLIQKAETVVLDHFENYQKQTIRNRAYILNSQGKQILTVPVKGASKKMPIWETQIDNSFAWEKNLLRSIQTAYGKSPFFEFYFDYIEKIITRKHDKLVDLNEELLTMCLKLLKIKKSIVLSDTYILPNATFVDTRIETYSQNFGFQEYQQVFGNEFAEDLCIIDLMFCEGPNATNILQNSITRV
jgi:WbqC-like protein family